MTTTNDERLRLLVVDDEANILKSLRRLFRGEPFDVGVVGSADEALRFMAENDVHVLLSDNKMPGMSGIELVQEVRGRYPDSIRMLFSGQSDMDAVIRAVNQGEVYRFILKPWNDIDLKVAVNLAFAHWKLNNDLKTLKKNYDELRQALTHILERHPELEKELTLSL